MSGPSELALAAGILADAGLKATVVMGVGWASTRFLHGRSAAVRHAVWAATLLRLPALLLFAAQRGPAIALDAPWLVVLWAAGFGLALLPVARGMLALRGLRARALPDPSTPGVVCSDRVAGPLTWGLLRPVIVLPLAAASWPPAHRDAALAHERAHIARGDWVVHMGVWCTAALFWFHPLVWLARRALAREAEHAADDAVLNQGFRPSDYATLLVSLATPRTPPAALGVAPSLVGTRVRSVLTPRSRSPRRWPVALGALLLAFLGLPALGAWPTWTAPPESLTCEPGPLP